MTQPDPHAVGRLWIEEGEAQTGTTATVAPIGPLDRTYTYTVPAEFAGCLTVGQRVLVPLGRRGRLVAAFCVALGAEPWQNTLRPLHALVDDESYLSEPLLELGRWMARYYCCPLGTTLAALVPEAVRKKSGSVTVRSARLVQPCAQVIAETPRLGAKSRVLLETLAAAGGLLTVDTLLARAGTTAATLRTAVNRGWVEILSERRLPPAPAVEVPRAEPTFDLTAAQQTAVTRLGTKLDAGGFGVTLLFGVSGSGKTEVYIRAMRQVLARGRQVIFLVPEIALTTQLVHRLACRFDEVAVVHSGLTGVERSLTWRAIASGARRVIIGTRSAVFAPCPTLGLLVVDEEQEPSYKNLQAPRFHVRDVAIKRAQMAGIPIVLGSATPSLETWVNCTRLEHYERIDLPQRVRDLPMPTVHVVDMRGRPSQDPDEPVLAELTRQKLQATLRRGEQGVVLINRRGFASVIGCPVCRWRLRCPQCDVSMVFHHARQQAVCHHCHVRVSPPDVCPDPSCRTPLVRTGAGTQRVEQELAAAFPAARLARADSDTMKRAADYQSLVDRFSAREIDVLLGTQMIGKGLDFPAVSFVAVVGADLAGSGSDYRATERLFQLVTQVAGRAGREQAGGEVVVQTLIPDAVAVQAAIHHDFARFAEEELAMRRQVAYPPFARLTRFVFGDAAEPRLRSATGSFAADVRCAIAELSASDADVLGPQVCALRRVRGRYRHELLLRTRGAESMQRILDHLRGAHRLRPKVQTFIVDVDPVSFD